MPVDGRGCGNRCVDRAINTGCGVCVIFSALCICCQERKAQQSTGKQSFEQQLLEKKRRQLLERQRKAEEEEVRGCWSCLAWLLR